MAVLFEREMSLPCRRDYFRVFCFLCEEIRSFLQSFLRGKGDAWGRTGIAASPDV